MRVSVANRFARGGVLVAVAVLVASCYTPYNLPVRVETNKTASVMSVNDSRQMVTMGSPYIYLEKPDVDWAKARVDAAEVCKERTGLAGAEPVGRTRRECMSQVGSDCVRYAIVGDYRCIDAPEPTPDD